MKGNCTRGHCVVYMDACGWLIDSMPGGHEPRALETRFSVLSHVGCGDFFPLKDVLGLCYQTVIPVMIVDTLPQSPQRSSGPDEMIVDVKREPGGPNPDRRDPSGGGKSSPARTV